MYCASSVTSFDRIEGSSKEDPSISYVQGDGISYKLR